MTELPAAEQLSDPMIADRMPPGREPDDDGPPDTLYVVDPSAMPGGLARTHEMPTEAGIPTSYTFSYNTPLLVPFTHAMRFLSSGFHVAEDVEMTRAFEASRDAKEGHDGHGVTRLRADEVIARLDELLFDALVARGAALPGGEILGRNTSKEEVIDFIRGFNERTVAGRENVEVGDLVDGDGGIGLDEQQRVTEAAAREQQTAI